VSGTPRSSEPSTSEVEHTRQPARDERRRLPVGLFVIVGLLLGIALGVFCSYWLPWIAPRFARHLEPNAPVATSGSAESCPEDTQGYAHTESAHAHAGHNDETSLSLTEHGRKNANLELATVELRDFERTIAVPATIVGREGRSEIAVSAPMTGIVTRVYPIRGESVAAGSPLFDLRLTHEDLVEKQASLLRMLEEMDVVKNELTRLERVTASGAVAGKTLLDRKYEQQKTEAAIRAEMQALLLHGLTPEQIVQIKEDRELLAKLTITAPTHSDSHAGGVHGDYLQVARLSTRLGEHVTTGTQLVALTDHCELYIEGKAFEHDAETLNRAAEQGLSVTALIETNSAEKQEIQNLKILYIENQIDLDSLALRFYVSLPNKLVRDEKLADGHRFIGWKYRPGQRVELLVPVERWENKIVLPIESVVQEGLDFFVYQQFADHFDRKPVHVVYRDQRWAVIGSDGTLFPGDVIAARGAYQLHLALKNKAGGGADPHAGHHH
jgi:membrane fusion protein, heavy metal efflux system